MCELKATVLIDNIAQQNLKHEWGLCVYIEYKGRKILLDTGSSGKFADNAAALGIDLSSVDCGVLSHAHYDHANGLSRFFKENRSAIFYMREGAAEDCYGKRWIFKKYIGLKKGTLKKYSRRIRFVSGDCEIIPGVTLVPHKTEGLEAIGKRANLYRKTKEGLCPDCFAHEQSLVFETTKGLVIFNSCSHGGADTIAQEVAQSFPDKNIYALIGGLHLFVLNNDEVHAVADRIKSTGIQRVITGHCTGDKAFEILKAELGENAQQLSSGFTFTV